MSILDIFEAFHDFITHVFSPKYFFDNLKEPIVSDLMNCSNLTMVLI